MSQAQAAEFLIGIILVCTVFNGLLTFINVKLFTEFAKQRMQERREASHGK